MLLALVFAGTLSISDADSAYANHDYKQAAVLYQSVVQTDPQNARAWYRLGVSDAAIGENAQAVTALRRALALGFDSMSVHYRLAAVAAASADSQGAVSELKLAEAARPFDPESLADDHAFDSVRSGAAFVSFLDEQNRAFHPCRYDAAYHALDFWQGDWSVSGRNGNAGTSHVESGADGCAILEQWTGLYDAPGRSITTFDPGRHAWIQDYVSGKGIRTEYVGRVLPDGSMEFVSGNGETRQRMTFTRLPDGTMRQRFEISKDSGATWSAPNDLIYSKR